MMRSRPPFNVLIAEDDPDDRLLIGEAIEEAQLRTELHFVEDGERLMEFLYQCRCSTKQYPCLLILDLNMPRKDGREALQEIKADDVLRRIPVVVFTTSQAEEDIRSSYELGANSFVVKPGSFDDLVTAMEVIGRYWLDVVELPQ